MIILVYKHVTVVISLKMMSTTNNILQNDCVFIKRKMIIESTKFIQERTMRDKGIILELPRF